MQCFNHFSKNVYSNTFRVTNSLDQDQARQNVGPVLGPNCFQGLPADDTDKELKYISASQRQCCNNAIMPYFISFYFFFLG